MQSRTSNNTETPSRGYFNILDTQQYHKFWTYTTITPGAYYTELSTHSPKVKNSMIVEIRQEVVSHRQRSRSWRYLRIMNEFRPIAEVLRRLIAAATFYGICLYLMSIMAVVSGMRYPKEVPDLPDLGFELIPVMDRQDTTIPNALLLIALIGSVVRCLFHDKGITVIRRFFVIHGLCALFRCVCMVATSYPDPNRLCSSYHPPATTYLFWRETFIHTGFLTCGDLMFSGHTLAFFLVALTWQKYFTKYEKPFVWILMLFACSSLVATRMHYTDDVLIAAYVAVTAFWFYHYAASPSVRKTIPILNWLEKEIGGDQVKIEKQDLLENAAEAPSNIGLRRSAEQIV